MDGLRLAADGQRLTDTASQAPRWLARVALVAIIAGGAVRIWAYTQRGSLWLDEASLALNVLGRGFGGLASPLDWGQAAPVGFLWALKLLTVVLGSAEWVLRLWPFVAGVTTLPLTWIVGRRLVGAPAAVLATVAMAFSLIAIRYSTEAKPYASDAGIALALVWFATRVMDAPDDKRRWRSLRIAGVVAVLLSLPSVFVLAAIGMALAPTAWRAGRWPRFAVAAAACEWMTTFVIIWFVVVREASSGDYLKEYWAPVMLTFSAPDFLARVIRMFASVAATPLRWDGDLVPALVTIGVAICGVWAVARKQPAFAILLAGPAALGAAASLIGVYPMSDRLAFFAAPLALVAAAKCVAGVAGMPTRRAGDRATQGAVIATAVALAAWVGSDSWRMLRAPGALEPTRDLYRAIWAQADSEAVPVYVFARAVPAWVYATTNWKAPDRARLERYTRIAGGTESSGHENFARSGPVQVGEGQLLVVEPQDDRKRLSELAGLAPGVRYRVAGAMSQEAPSPGWAAEEARRIRSAANPVAWIVASHFFEGSPRDELRPLVDALREAGARVSEERRGGRDALALRIEAPGAVSPAASPPRP